MTRQYQAIKGRKGSIAVLDIGTNKIACLIAERGEDGELAITGSSHKLARGLKSGVVVDSTELEDSILSAVHQAEEMAGVNIDNVIVNLTGSDLQSHSVTVELQISGEGVTEQDIADLLQEGCASVHDRHNSIIHCFAVQYYLDGAQGIRDPRHMYGQVLGADLNIITANSARLRNLASCIGRCHLNVAEFVVSPHASALGVLDADEMELGVTVIDMGGSDTSYAVYCGGRNIFSGSIPVGGQHITSDVAQGLSTTLASAERLKTLQGSVIAAHSDHDSLIDVDQFGESENSDGNQVPKINLINIIRPRAEETFELVRSRIEEAGVYRKSGNHVVLTGGASQLSGMEQLAANMLSKQVRTAKPKLLPGLADSISGTPFSCSVGMVNFAEKRPMEDGLFDTRRRNSGIASRGQRLVSWLKDNF